MDQIKERVCKGCGEVIPFSWGFQHPRQEFCGNGCSAKVYREKKKREKVLAAGGPWACEGCGALAVWRLNGRFCGVSCAGASKGASKGKRTVDRGKAVDRGQLTVDRGELVDDVDEGGGDVGFAADRNVRDPGRVRYPGRHGRSRSLAEAEAIAAVLPLEGMVSPAVMREHGLTGYAKAARRVSSEWSS